MENAEYIERIGRYIAVLYRSAQKYINKKMQPVGFTSSDHLFLIHISKNEGINQRRLAQILSIDESAVTRAAKKLEESGFVRRTKDPCDLRSFSLFLTPKGQKAVPLLVQTFEEWDKVLLKDFTAEELAVLRKQLAKMVQNTSLPVQEDA